MRTVFMWINEIALFATVFVFTHTQIRKENFKKYIFISIAIYTGLIFVLNTLLDKNIVQADIYVRIFWYLMVSCIIRFCWEVKWSYAFYYGIWSFISWQLLYELWLFVIAVTAVRPAEYPVYSAIGNIAVFVAGYGVAAATFAKWMTREINKIGPRQLCSGVLIFLVFETIGMAQRRMDIAAGDSRWELLYLTQVLVTVVLYLQNEVFRKSALRQELSLMNLLHKKEHEQYQLAKENIELINQKCHDLKHQIRAIRNMDKSDIDKYIDDIEKSVNIYESIVHTGNEVLDTILTEKSLYCANHNITISCVADGSQLGFINAVDLYSLLGNALDNAIEAVEKFEEKEKRQIDVVIFRQRQFVVVNILNPVSGDIKFEEEVPVTTKGDRDYHGYGIKSIKYVAKKYDGFVNIKTEDGCFMLEILFPVS